MAKWKSQAQIQEELEVSAFCAVGDDIKEQIAQQVAIWNEQGYPENHSDCEKALNALISQSTVWQALATKNLQYASKAMTINYFMRDIDKVIRARKAEREKQRVAAFKAASASRAIVYEGVSSSASTPGDIIEVKAQTMMPRILTCIECRYIPREDDYGQFDGGYLISYAEPTDEEKTTEAYLRAKKSLDDNQAIEQAQRERIEARRQQALAEMREQGHEPTWLDEMFAGTSDN